MDVMPGFRKLGSNVSCMNNNPAVSGADQRTGHPPTVLSALNRGAKWGRVVDASNRLGLNQAMHKFEVFHNLRDALG